MIKKITLASVAVVALMSVTAQAEMMKCQAGKCGAGMAKMDKSQMKQKKQKMASPFLIKHGLPHYTKLLMKNWDDPKLALTPDQKAKLMEVRKETLDSVMKLKPEVMALRSEIIQAGMSGTKASDLKEKVEKLASLEAEATMVHLHCIENTKAVLKPEQMKYMLEKKNAMHGMKKGKMQGMKCQAGKCGGAK